MTPPPPTRLNGLVSPSSCVILSPLFSRPLLAFSQVFTRRPLQIYLNNNFTNGSTTFFLPSPSQTGVLHAYPVKPVAGCALVFPHGDTRGSLLHEGSPVGEGGGKYVIRTDVLYEVAPRGRGVEEVEA